MRKFRYIFRLSLAFLSKYKGIIFLAVIVGIISFFIIYFISILFFSKEYEVIGISGRYHTEELPLEILALIGDGLTIVKNDGTVEPSLALSWETPDKGKTWLFNIKDDIYWHNNEKVTAYNISYNFSDVEIKIESDKTISFSLKEPFSPFPTVVSTPVFLKGLIGTGEWKISDLKIVNTYVQELLLEKKVASNGSDKLIQKLYKFYPTEERVKLAFKLGEIDSIQNSINSKPFDSWDNVSIDKKINESQIVTVFFNNSDPKLSEKKLRQALYYAIDKKSFDGERAISSISKTSWAYNPQVKKYSYDKDRSKELIDELSDEFINDININLVSAPPLLTTAEHIAQYWNDIGINTTVKVSSVIPDDFQAYLTIFQTPKDPDQYSLWHTTQGLTNISKYSNVRIDKLLEDARTELDIEERRKYYLDFQRFLLEDVPALFLYHPNQYNISRK
jgi:peptide/nickel transport system substrate-binding protein